MNIEEGFKIIVQREQTIDRVSKQSLRPIDVSSPLGEYRESAPLAAIVRDASA